MRSFEGKMFAKTMQDFVIYYKQNDRAVYIVYLVTDNDK